MRSGLFQFGRFQLSSGQASSWKIDCESLSDSDIDTLAYLVAGMVAPFDRVVSVPTGGDRLARKLCEVARMYQPGMRPVPYRHLIVDDVLTTGGSMERNREAIRLSCPPTDLVQGAVLFARGPCPDWVIPLFRMPECFYA